MRWILFLVVIMISATTVTAADLGAADVARFARLALDCVHQEYPNKISHVLQSDADVAPPRALSPAFHGCFDWHSAVHGHWLLARLARLYPEADFAAEAREALTRSSHAAEHRGRGRLLRAARTAPASSVPMASRGCCSWRPSCASGRPRTPTTTRCAPGPLPWRRWRRRSPTACATGCPSCTTRSAPANTARRPSPSGWRWDWARVAGDAELADLVADRAPFYHAGDADCPLGYEPGGQDFLSPCLAEADLMRRVLPPDGVRRLVRDLPARAARRRLRGMATRGRGHRSQGRQAGPPQGNRMS